MREKGSLAAEASECGIKPKDAQIAPSEKYTDATGFALDKASRMVNSGAATNALNPHRQHLFALRLPAATHSTDAGYGFLQLLTLIGIEQNL